MFDSSSPSPDSKPFVVWVLSYLLLAGFAVFGTPFLIDYLNSGDQLPPTLQIIDPQLFPQDSVVSAMGRLKSGFYLTWAEVMKLLKIKPSQIELAAYSLFIISKLLLTAGILFLCRSLKNSFWFFVVFAAWSCHQKPSLLGSVTFYMPLITHNEVATVMGLFAIACLLRDKFMLFWLLAGAMVLVHVLVGLQFVLCFMPVLLWQRKLDKNLVLGIGLLGLCCLLYLITMVPPSMNGPDWQLFLSANGNTGHISLFRFDRLEWLGFVSVFGLAMMMFNRFLKDHKGFELLRNAAACGSIIGLTMSLASVTSQAMKPMLFQPMRIFFWVTLISYLIIAAAMIEAFKNSQTIIGILSASVLTLLVLNSLLVPLFSIIGFTYSVVEWLREKYSWSFAAKIKAVTQGIIVCSIAGICAAWALGTHQPIGSLRSPTLLLPCFICLVALFWPKPSRMGLSAAILLILYCLTAASIYRYEYNKRWLDPDWRTTRLWVQSNTKVTDRFITPPDQIGFRVLSLRTTVSESLPRVIWSDPQTYLENKLLAERASKGYVENSTNLAYLFELAREWGCDYVIARNNYDSNFTPLFRAGKFSVLKVPQ